MPSETWPSGRSPTTTLVDFRAPSARVRFGGPRIASFACSRCSVLRVCQPSRRFPSSEPESALFHADSALGTFSLRSFLRWRVAARFRARSSPRTVFPSGYTTSLARQGRPRKAAVSGLMPARASSGQANERLIRRLPDAPLGFSLLGLARECLARDFARRSSRVLLGASLRRTTRTAGTSESQSTLA